MKKIGLLSISFAVLLSCSRDDKETPSEDTGNLDKTPKISQIIEEGKLLNAYVWNDNFLVKKEYYKDGFLTSYDKISYTGQLMHTDSTFSVDNSFKKRNVYHYNSFENLILTQTYEVGYAYKKRNDLLVKLNQGLISQEEYRKGIDELKNFYSNAMLTKVAKINAEPGTKAYNDAIIEIEKTGDALSVEKFYSYDEKNLISQIVTHIDKKKVNTQVYQYNENKTLLTIKTIFFPSEKYILSSYILDEKPGVYHKTQANKADWFANALERKLVENTTGTIIRNYNYSYTYTYDEKGYPISSIYTKTNGEKVQRKYIWK